MLKINDSDPNGTDLNIVIPAKAMIQRLQGPKAQGSGLRWDGETGEIALKSLRFDSDPIVRCRSWSRINCLRPLWLGSSTYRVSVIRGELTRMLHRLDILLLVNALITSRHWLARWSARGIDQWLYPAKRRRKLYSTFRLGQEPLIRSWLMKPVWHLVTTSTNVAGKFYLLGFTGGKAYDPC